MKFNIVVFNQTKYLLTIYDKSEKENISDKELDELLSLALLKKAWQIRGFFDSYSISTIALLPYISPNLPPIKNHFKILFS